MKTNPRTIALCIAVFLASAFITYTLKIGHHSATSGHWLPAVRHTRAHNQYIVSTPKVAYATFLAANTHPEGEEDVPDDQDGNFLSTRVLAYQLLHSRTAGTNLSIAFLVLCTRDVSKRKRDRLKKDGATVVLVERLNTDGVVAAADRQRDVLTKLRLFQLVQYAKILFVDANTLVKKPLDSVFHDEGTLTQATGMNPEKIQQDEGVLPRTYMFATHGDLQGYDHSYLQDPNLDYSNCGFFVFTPSKVLFDYYLSLLKLPGRFDTGFPEQILLNYAHRRDGNMPWKPLWYGWNVNWPTERDWRGGAHSFHAKYWDGDPSHDPVLMAIWNRRRRRWKVTTEGEKGQRDSRSPYDSVAAALDSQTSKTPSSRVLSWVHPRKLPTYVVPNLPRVAQR
ncbi:hypothetical protein LTR91_026278 [Friedmanniomyces endolithicus]|uniref:Nucleotide-diphospho-sugar transferase n=1 Tax=Friedmanniomyces endolithicus TaxID=329885 RepID=A0AAN6GX86_9PEZI|nr:hypothetical protein LTR57_025372 [Friedmanniomyces endolithicus]KAK0949653.1 hypothetical protein LTR91_026278 [Friedmanniomyces endolithicus]KAK0954784.1 hypothetical protein LTS01_023740 [Friedmanniomyces endolithicus]KAK1027008.1 hypothetical protein LTS16_021820 [Friedmanniomyces endolithicus]